MEDMIAQVLELRIQIKYIKTFFSIEKFPCKAQKDFYSCKSTHPKRVSPFKGAACGVPHHIKSSVSIFSELHSVNPGCQEETGLF